MNGEFLELPWGIDVTILNLKDIRDQLVYRLLRGNVNGKGEQNKKEAEFDFNRAISALEAQQADAWIPITEDESTYPECFTEVIFTDGESIYIGCCDPNYEWSSTNQEDSIQIEAVTAWKPLPTPYKEDSSETNII